MILKKGDKSPTKIKALQTDLNRLGYLTAVTGIFDSKTEISLKAFQKANHLEADGKYGPLSQATVAQVMPAGPLNEIAPPSPVSLSTTPWLDYLVRNIGEKEMPGTAANPFITALFSYTTLKGSRLATTDETAWCAAAMCTALEKNGYESPHSATAASFDSYGEDLGIAKIKPGALVTIKTSTGSRRHITCFLKWANAKKTEMICVGGNQANSIKQSTFAVSSVAKVRWPVKKKQA